MKRMNDEDFAELKAAWEYKGRNPYNTAGMFIAERAEVERLKRDHAPHYCSIDHPPIRHWESGEDERCPLCQMRDEKDAAMKRLVEAAKRGCDKCEYEDGYIELCREEARCGFADLRAVLEEMRI